MSTKHLDFFIICFGLYTASLAANNFEEIFQNNTNSKNIWYQTALHSGAYIVVLYIFSFFYNNCSFIDFQWSVYPLIRAVQIYERRENKNFNLAFFLPFMMLLIYATRLTCQPIREFYSNNGLRHQDWRYQKFEKMMPFRFIYWIFAFCAFFVTPYVCVTLMTMPFLSFINRLNFKDHTITDMQLIGLAVMFISQIIQGSADFDLYEWRQERKSRDMVITKGFWAYSRHPNYFGEILFWWGIWIYCFQGSGYQYPWGPFVESILFIYGTGPLMEKMLLENKPRYQKYKNCVISAYVPFLTIGRVSKINQ